MPKACKRGFSPRVKQAYDNDLTEKLSVTTFREHRDYCEVCVFRYRVCKRKQNYR